MRIQPLGFHDTLTYSFPFYSMKKFFLPIFALAFSLSAFAQSNDPVLMHINGKPVTRSEFEYSYNKNSNIEGAVEHKTVDEYVEMFVNYKLKVEAAEAMRMDTLSSFKGEFAQYRDIQLKPFLVDSAFIDSVAYSVYTQTQAQLKGKDMLRVAHILLMVPQNATQGAVDFTSHRIDSIYDALKHGADFAEMAKQFSDDRGTRAKGGELPWIGPDMTLKEFENAAYALQNGEMSRPVKTSVGFHIIKMLERKQLEPYAQLKSMIVEGLKRQGIEENSADYRIGKIVEASHGRLTREAVLDSVMNAEVATNADLKYLIEEYHDGLLLYEISKQEIWDPASNDKQALAKIFKKNKKTYAWDEPRFKGFVISAKSEQALKKAKKLLKKYGEGEWQAEIKKQLNKDSVQVRVVGPVLVKKGENKLADQFIFGGDEVKTRAPFVFAGVQGKKLKQPATYVDVKSQVETTLQERLEKAWIEKLRQQFPVEIDKAVLATVNKH